MVKIIHKKGGVYLPKYGLKFEKGKSVDVTDEALIEKILRNKDFQIEGEKTKKKEKKDKGDSE